MRIIAPMMILIMMTSTLAGCTGGDSDSGGNDNIDMDVLNQLIDDNLQDFINNTTITVENHYHNNTTVMNDNTDNSVSNINGSSSFSTSTMQMFTVEWDRTEYIFQELNTNIQPGERIVTLTGESNNNSNGSSNNNGMGGDNTLLFSYGYNGYVIELRMNCNEYKHYVSYWDDGEWRVWLEDNYGLAGTWQERESLAEDIVEDINNNFNNGFNANQQCGYGTTASVDSVVVYEIDLDQGEAISILVNGPYVTTRIECEDDFTISEVTTEFIGGQSDCIVSGVSSLGYEIRSTNSGIFDPYAQRNMTSWEYFTDYFSNGNWMSNNIYSVPEEFAVYFNLHEVVVYDLEE